MIIGILMDREDRTVVVDPVFPPIPTTRFDWSARFDEYDVCQDPDCDCRAAADNAVGHGATEQDAVAELLEEYEFRNS